MTQNKMVVFVSDEFDEDQGEPLLSDNKVSDALHKITRRAANVSIDVLRESWHEFITNAGLIIDSVSPEIAGRSIQSIELSAEVNAEGKIGFSGSGGKIGNSVAIKIILGPVK